MTLWVIVLLSSLLLPLGCAGGTKSSGAETVATEPKPSSIVAQLPANVKKKLSEELGPMPVHEVVDQECGIRLSIEAPKAPEIEVIEEDESVHTFLIEIPEGIIRCYLYGDLVDAAYTLEDFLRLFADGNDVDWYAIDETGVSVVEGRPYLHATAITRELKEDQDLNLWGNLHVAVGTARHESLGCIAGGPGRRATFRRIFERMLKSVDTPLTKIPDGLVYLSIARLTSPGGGLAGYAEVFVFDEEGGETLMEHSLSRIARTVDLHLAGKDVYDVVRSKSGTIASGTYAEASGGVLDFELELASLQESPNAYRVSGTVKDKEFEATIFTESGIADVRRQARQVADFVRTGSGKVISLESYDPSTDPSRLLTVLIERKARTPEGIEAVVSMAGLHQVAEIDENGDMVSMVVEAAGVRMDMERVWIQGSLVD